MVARNHNPILFVDIDGVLNPFAGPCPEGFMEISLLPNDEEPVRICSAHSGWLAELSDSFDLIWATAWTEEERRLLRTVLELPDFVAAASMPPKPLVPERKVEGIRDLALDSATAWIDDMITAQAARPIRGTGTNGDRRPEDGDASGSGLPGLRRIAHE